MKICLVRPPCITNPVAYIASLTPPIGVAYLASALRQAGHRVTVIDSIGENSDQAVALDGNLMLRGLTFQEVVARIPKDTDLIGISGMFSSEWVQIRKMVNLIGEHFPKTFTVCGGEHFTAAPELSMEYCPNISAIVLGEGEVSLVELVNVLEKGGDVASVKGLVLRKDGKFVRTGTRARVKTVDEIPQPAWDLIPLNTYLDKGLSYGVNRGRSMPMLASRGCPYQCTFCSNPMMWTNRWIARDPIKVVDEIEQYVTLYKVNNVDFYDLTAIVQKDWIVEFCKELVRRNINITWQLPSGTRSEAIDSEVSQWLFKAGCRNLNYAPESGSIKTLERIKKKVKLPRLIESLRGAVAAGLNVKMNIIIGLPDETHWDVWKTLLFLVRLSFHGAHDVSIGVFAPYPGSELYERLVKEGRITHSDEYWSKLAYVDITETVSYTQHVTSSWLRVYNWIGFALFYGSNYLFRPKRFFRTLRNLYTHQHESRGEMALAALVNRVKVFKEKQAS